MLRPSNAVKMMKLQLASSIVLLLGLVTVHGKTTANKQNMPTFILVFLFYVM